MKIHLTKKANKDLSEIHAFIGQDNVHAASRTINIILDAIEYLLEFPIMGRAGRVPHTRELIISSTPFIAIYEIRRQDIFILRILHAARKWPVTLQT